MTDVGDLGDPAASEAGFDVDLKHAQRRRLTARQRAVLDFIVLSSQATGMPPTLREIGAHMGIRSTNGVADHLRALERKGYISRREMASRGIRVLVALDPAASLDVTNDICSPDEAIEVLRLTYDVIVRGANRTYDLRVKLMRLYEKYPLLASMLEIKG